jgi:hypothetical protein
MSHGGCGNLLASRERRELGGVRKTRFCREHPVPPAESGGVGQPHLWLCKGGQGIKSALDALGVFWNSPKINFVATFTLAPVV